MNAYGKTGRLGEAQETPAGSECTTRAYTYDADPNRLTKKTRSSDVKGACVTTGGTPQKYAYDPADRLTGPTYDAWGRIESLPAEFAGGSTLTTNYFANNMVATAAQNGVTNTFQLDATGRQRQREQAGGVLWRRNLPLRRAGRLAFVDLARFNLDPERHRDRRRTCRRAGSSGTTTFKLTDLHDDVVASASASPTATTLLATYRFDEFGEPMSSPGAERFGWLGGKARRAELPLPDKGDGPDAPDPEDPAGDTLGLTPVG